MDTNLLKKSCKQHIYGNVYGYLYELLIQIDVSDLQGFNGTLVVLVNKKFINKKSSTDLSASLFRFKQV